MATSAERWTEGEASRGARPPCIDARGGASQPLCLLYGEVRAIDVVDALDMYVNDCIPMWATLDPVMEIGNLTQKRLVVEQAYVSAVARYYVSARLAAQCVIGHRSSPSILGSSLPAPPPAPA